MEVADFLLNVSCVLNDDGGTEEAEEKAWEMEGERDEAESGFTIATVSSAADEPTSISKAGFGVATGA